MLRPGTARKTESQSDRSMIRKPAACGMPSRNDVSARERWPQSEVVVSPLSFGPASAEAQCSSKEEASAALFSMGL